MRTLIITSGQLTSAEAEEIAAGKRPRRDFIELADTTQADLLTPDLVDQLVSARLVRSMCGTTLAQIYLAWRRRKHYDVIFTDSERLGLPLALLLGVSCLFTRRCPRHIMIGHLLTTTLKRFFLNLPSVLSHIDTIVCHSNTQYQLLIDTMGIPPEKIALVPYQVDTKFWRPQLVAESKVQICSIGLEFRDYQTLFEAVTDLEVTITIVPGSFWSKHRHTLTTAPATIHIENRLSYPALRDLYSQSRFIVVPLLDVPNQAGITTILEAMAMGKAVIVSHTSGQQDIVKDRRCQPRHKTSSPLHSSFLEELGMVPSSLQQPNGIYVEPNNSISLKKAITYLLEHPEEAERMGSNGRRLVEATMDSTHFVQRIAFLLQDKAVPQGVPAL